MELRLKKIKVPEVIGHDMAMPSMMPPSFHVDGKQMSELKNWEVGKKYRLVIEVEQKSKNEYEDNVSAGFDIIAYKHLTEKSYDEMTDKEMEIEQGKALANK